MIALPAEAITLLRDRSFGHVAFVDAVGLPHVSPVWVDVTDDGHVLINTAEGRVKDRALAVGAPVAVSVGMPDRPYEFVLIRGVVSQRTHEGAAATIDRLAQKYRGTNFSLPDGQVRVTILIEPETVHIH